MDDNTYYAGKKIDAFISWNHHDSGLASNCNNYIKEAGFSTYFSDDGDAGGKLENIFKYVRNCKVFIILITPNTLNSFWCLAELIEAYRYVGENYILPLWINHSYEYQNVRIVNNRPNAFSYELYKGNRKSFEIIDGYITNDQEVNDVLDSLYKKIISLLKGDDIDKEAYLNMFKDILLNVELKNINQIQEIFDVKKIYSLSKNIKIDNADELYVPRHLTFDNNEDKKESDENELIQYIVNDNDVLITASGGSGKTELIKRIKNEISLKNGYISYYIKCSDLSSSKDSLFYYLTKQISSRLPHLKFDDNNLKHLFDQTKFVLLLDGFDEVVTPVGRNNLLGKINDFKKDYKLPLVVTSRFDINDTNDVNFKRYKLNDFDNDEAKNFANGLYKKIKGEYQEIYHKFESVDKKIKHNPLFLSQLVFIYHLDNKVLKTKYEILKETSSYIINVDEYRKLFNDEEKQQIAIDLTKDMLPYLSFESIYNNNNKPVDNYFKNIQGGTLFVSTIKQFLTSRNIINNDGGLLLLPTFYDYYAAEYVYNNYFVNKIYKDEFIEFLKNHHDKNELIEMLILKIDHELQNDKYKALHLNNFINTLINNDVDINVIFNAASSALSSDDINIFALINYTSYIIKNKLNYYHKYFYIIKHYHLEKLMDVMMNILMDDNDINKDILISLYRDYHFIISTERYVISLDKKTLLSIREYIITHPSYRHSVNALFYKAKAEYINDYIDENVKRIHPFFFNLYCLKQEDESEMMGKQILDINYDDELGIYEHFIKEGEEHIGLLSLDYDEDFIYQELKNNKDDKIIGLIFGSSKTHEFKTLPIYKNEISVLLIPSNIDVLKEHSLKIYGMNDSNATLYIEYGIEKIPQYVSGHYFKNIYMPSSVIWILHYFEDSSYSFNSSQISINNIYFSNNLSDRNRFLLSSFYINNKLKLPKSLSSLDRGYFDEIECPYLILPRSVTSFDMKEMGIDTKILFVHKESKMSFNGVGWMMHPDTYVLVVFEGAIGEHLIESKDIERFPNYIHNVDFKNIIMWDGFLYIRDEEGLILFYRYKETFDTKSYDIPDNLEIDGEEVLIHTVNIYLFDDFDMVILPNHKVKMLFELEGDYYHLNDLYVEHYQDDTKWPLIVIGNIDEDSKNNDFCADYIFVNIPDFYQTKCYIIENVLYWIYDDVCHVGAITEIDNKKINILPEIKIDGDIFKVKQIDKNIFGRYIVDFIQINEKINVFIPSSIEIFEEQEFLEGLEDDLIFRTDTTNIPDGWSESVTRLFSYQEITRINGYEYQGAIYDIEENGTATFRTCLEGVSNISIPSFTEVKGNEIEVTAVYIMCYKGRIDGTPCLKLNNMLLPDSLTYFKFDEIQKSSLCYNQYEDGLYLGSESNPYLVLAFNQENKTIHVHNKTKIINIINGDFDTVYIPQSVISIHSIISKNNNYSIYYDGSINDWLKIENKDIVYKGLKHLYTKDSNGAYVEVRDITIPGDFKSIKKDSFTECELFDSITLEEGIEEIGSMNFFDCSCSKIFLPRSLKKIGFNAFGSSNNEHIQNIYYHGSLDDWLNKRLDIDFKSHVGQCYFYYFENDKYVSIESLKLLENIEIDALKRLFTFSNIKYLYVPNCYKDYPLNVFLENPSLEVVVFDFDGTPLLIDDNLHFDLLPHLFFKGEDDVGINKGNLYIIGKKEYLFSQNNCIYIIQDNNAKLVHVDKSLEVIHIPNYIDYQGKQYPVVEIGNGVFVSNRNLKEIVLPDKLTKIGTTMFDIFNMSLHEDGGDFFIGSNNNPLFMQVFNPEKSNKKIIFVRDSVVFFYTESYFSFNSGSGTIIYIDNPNFKDFVIASKTDRTQVLGSLLLTSNSYYSTHCPYLINNVKKEDIVYEDGMTFLLKDGCAEVLLMENKTGYIEIKKEIIINNKIYPVIKIHQTAFNNVENAMILDIQANIQSVVFDNVHLYIKMRIFCKDDIKEYIKTKTLTLTFINVYSRSKLLLIDGLCFLIKDNGKLLLFGMTHEMKECHLKEKYMYQNKEYELEEVDSQLFDYENYDSLYLVKTISKINIKKQSINKNIYFEGTLLELLQIDIGSSFPTIIPKEHLYLLNEKDNYYNFYEAKIIVVPEKVRDIKNSLFSGLDNLEEIIFPSSLQRISNRLLSSNNNLKRVVFHPDAHLLSLGERLFKKCYKLEKVILPKNVDYIHPDCFYDCGLKKVDIPLYLKGTLNHVESEVEDGDIVHVTFSSDNISSVDEDYLFN